MILIGCHDCPSNIHGIKKYINDRKTLLLILINFTTKAITPSIHLLWASFFSSFSKREKKKPLPD